MNKKGFLRETSFVTLTVTTLINGQAGRRVKNLNLEILYNYILPTSTEGFFSKLGHGA